MRKLYVLLAGIFFTLSATKSFAFPPTTPDVANFVATINDSSTIVAFANTSTLGDEPGPRYANWDFGDGSNVWTGPLVGTTHIYAHPGTFNVCLKIYRFRSSGDSILSAMICKTIVIHYICAANFERVASASSSPLVATFKAIPWNNAGAPVTKICWVFGDGHDTCITYTSSNGGPYTVNHHYTQPGNYQVCVNITYYGGCVANKCKAIAIAADSCSADFERIVSSNASPLRVYFKALPQHNNNKKPSRVCWRFGDGSDTCINYAESFTGVYAVGHNYAHAGNYEVCVRIIYYGGCEASKCHQVIVGVPDTCGADFERIVSSTASPLRAYFKALPQHNNNKKPSRVCWRFGDGSDTCVNYPESYTGVYAVGHNYAHAGNYEVCVRIIYYGGCEASKCHHVIVGIPDTCGADFERIPSSNASPLLTYFRALPSHNNNNKPSRICWRFGDGSDTCINYPASYTGQYVVSHRYSQPGNYEVCVNILYFGGCEARKCRIIQVPPPQPACTVHLFEIIPSITSLVRGFLAIPQSNATPPARPIRVCWYFGDGTDTCIMITAASPLNFTIRHTYPAPGQYRACVKVLFEGGCLAEDCREVVIRGANNICGGYMVDSLTGPRTYKFRGYSIHAPNDEVVSYRWTFGDGGTAVGQDVTHQFAQSGNFNVCLYIVTRLGCETRICKTIRVPGNNEPQLHLSPNPVVNIINVDFFSTHTEQVTVRILNNNGVQVRQYTRNVTVGPNNWTYDLTGLVPGLYSFVIQSPNQLASAIFIKQ